MVKSMFHARHRRWSLLCVWGLVLAVCVLTANATNMPSTNAAAKIEAGMVVTNQPNQTWVGVANLSCTTDETTVVVDFAGEFAYQSVLNTPLQRPSLKMLTATNCTTTAFESAHGSEGRIWAATNQSLLDEKTVRATEELACMAIANA